MGPSEPCRFWHRLRGIISVITIGRGTAVCNWEKSQSNLHMSSPGSCENHCSTPMLYHSSDLQMEELVNSQTLDLSASLRRRKWQPTPVFLPEKSHGQRRLAGYAHGVTKSRTRLSKHPLFTHRKSLGYIYIWKLPYGQQLCSFQLSWSLTFLTSPQGPSIIKQTKTFYLKRRSYTDKMRRQSYF